ncbi:MAG: Ig-like domain-containing protein, partial [Peptoniphilus harei]|nr:Ig-like domain-containing protein [Peptoniphilus harei]
MDNIFKRFTCLFLALLMILEVFSPVTALAAGSILVDEEEQPPKVEENISEQLFNKPAEKTSQKDTRKTTSNKKEEVHKNSSNKPKETGKAPELIPAKKTKNDYEFFENTRKDEAKAEEKAKAEAEAKAAEEAKAKEEQAAKENAELEKQKQELLRIEAEKQAQAARANEAEAAAAEAEYRDARQKRIELEKLLEEKLKEKGLRDQQKQESEKSLNEEKSNKLEDKKLEEEVTEEEEEKGLLEKIKEGLGLTDLQRADKELKKALKNKDNGLEEIQALLDTFEDKYDLSREDQAKLMEDNTEAFREFIERHGYENFDPQMFMGENDGLEIANLYSNRKGILIPQPLTPEEEAIGLQIIEEYRTEEKEEDSHGFMFFRASALMANESGLDGKKYTIITRFDTSNAGGSIQASQSFTINLDDRLTVKDESTLKPIVYNGKIIANPSYDKGTNSIKYTIAEAISENLQIPLAIDVDYNVEKIKELDRDATKHSIKNSITGIGVTKAVKLPETVVDDEGKVVNQIIEPGSKDVLEIVDQGEDYQVHMDVSGSPIVKDGEL